MIDLEFVIGKEKQTVRASKISMIYTGQMSVSYSLNVGVWNASRDFVAFMAAGHAVSIYLLTQKGGRDFLFSGVISQCKGNVSYFTFSVDDFGFYIIKNNKLDTSYPSEFSTYISGAIRKYGMLLSKRYTNTVFTYDNASGLIRDYVDVSCRATKLVWNIRDNILIIGDGLTGLITNFGTSSGPLESNSIAYKGSIVNLFSLNASFQPAVRVGDTLTIGVKSYIVVKIVHSYLIDDEMQLNNRTTQLTLASSVSDVSTYVNYTHEMRRTFEVNDVISPLVKYDSRTGNILFLDPINGTWKPHTHAYTELGGGMTPEGGVAMRLTNRTGALTIKGTMVIPSSAYDNSFSVSPTTAYDCIGTVYEPNVRDGELCWIVISGRADVLVEDSHAPTRGFFVNTSTTQAGRVITSAVPTGASFAAVNNHFREVGHCLESKSAGTDVLVKILMHFN